jgi:molecular chaperone DnaK (HSP70)
MIGIQVDKAGCSVVARVGPAIELIGSGTDLGVLIASARSRPGVDVTSGVVAVPAWYNDEQRVQIRDQARAAGVASVRLVNECTALALAYGETQAALPERPLIMSVSNAGAFDVTVMALRGDHYEVLAANGIPQLDLAAITDADRLFAAIEPVVKRALADAQNKPADLDVIILGAASAILAPAAVAIEAAWGRKPVEPPAPEIAIARGALLFGVKPATGAPVPVAASAPAPTTTPMPRSGCLSVLVVGVLLAIVPIFFV